nr:glycosyltransferase family 4 protein [uncultured Flavobacterium sp.]
MRIVQIIDSLEAGGAERMALNYANALVGRIAFSGLVVTRKEGILKKQLDAKVSYLFLQKTKSIDFGAVFRLRKFIKDNKIGFIHAHSSSFFIAVLVKLTFPKVKIIWHDHYGISQDLNARKNISLKIGSLFFAGSIAVNLALKKWAESYLWSSNIVYFSNFIISSFFSDEELFLQGVDDKRIICVANLREQKNHKLLISAANIICKKYPDWTFHLFGKDFEDDYSKEIMNLILNLRLNNNVFFYGTTEHVVSALKQCNIAVLPSLSEGLPLAILEYGRCKMPVVATNVGEVSSVINSGKEGLVVESDNLEQFSNSIIKFIENEEYRNKMGEALFRKIELSFSEQSIIKEYLYWLNSLSNFR